MIFFVVLILGAVSLSKLSVDLMPQIEPPNISVITVYEGAGAEDVETKVTEVIENNLATISNLDKITSRSLENLSIVSCRFNWGVNLDEASNDVRDKLEFAKRLLPDEIETPIVFKFNTAMIPVLFIGINSSPQTYSQLYHIVERQISDDIKRIPGVGAVQIYGGLERQINISIDRARLQGYGLSIGQIVDKLAAENITLPAGNLKSGYIDYDLRVPGEFSSVQQIKDIVIARQNDKIAYLRDIAEVADSFKEVTMVVRNNGRNGVMMMVQKRSGANTVKVVDQVLKELKAIQKRLPVGIEFSVLSDTSEHIRQSIRDLAQTIYWGGLFVILVVYLFLRAILPSLIISLTIPFSLIIAFIFMYFFGYTVNIMSLSSLAISIGMVVDNAIVVVDTIYRHRDKGKTPDLAAIEGALEVGLAVSASTFTTVIVFLPMVFLTGITGVMFKQLALIISVTLLASLFTALTLTPMLCAKLLKGTPKEKINNQGALLYRRFYQISAKFFQDLESAYSKLLSWSLGHKKTVILFAIGVFILSILLVPMIGTEFIPEEDTGDLNIQIELPVGTRVEQTDKVALQVEDILRREVPQAQTIFSRVGQSGSSRFGSVFGAKAGSNVINAGVKLVSASQRKQSVKEISESLRPKIKALLGVKKINIQAGSPFSRILFGGNKPISIEILGPNLEISDRLAYSLKQELSAVKGLTDITISRELGKPELQIEIDRLKASSLGLSMAQITETVRAYFYGKSAAKFRQEGNEYDIFVRLKESDRSSLKDITQMPISSPSGEVVTLGNIARILHRTGPIGIERQNQERIVKVEANIFRRSLGKVAGDIQGIISRQAIPAGMSVKLGSDVEEQAKSFRDLILLFLLGAILVYMVMAAQFESFIDPFVVMFSVPFAFTGVIFGLFASGITLSIISFLGLIMLSGIVVNNAIVLVDYINILRRRDMMPMQEAIPLGASTRLRPVLMTTITTLFGMLPLALSRGEGSELWQPLGVSMIGGLSLSTFITLILVPVLYAVFEKRRNPVAK
jgi:HAE1 family hydrophobic/amphiphilic exporter-1